MFVLKSIVAFLLLCVLSSVSAHPMPQGVQRRHHGVRARSTGGANGRCKPRPTTSSSLLSSSSTVSATETATATANTLAVTTTAATTSTHVPVTTSSVHSSSSTHATPSTSHSSSSASATPSKVPSAAGNSRAFAALAPVDNSVSSWSTSPDAPSPLPLDDATFQMSHLMTELPHPYVNAPDGQLSMQATYPQGSWNFEQQPLGGLSFYASGPSNVDLTTAKEVTFGYSVYFEEGFEFNLGGKLPGVYGGDSADEAYSCSDGRRSDGCFSSRLMWRTNGMGEMYTYLPPSYTANQAVCDIAPKSECNPTYGASVGRGSFNFVAGQSNAVAMRVRLNDVGQENGELQLWANGESVINVGGLVLRDSDEGRIYGLMVQTFFGGNTQEYASPKTQSTWFRDFTVAVTETL